MNAAILIGPSFRCHFFEVTKVMKHVILTAFVLTGVMLPVDFAYLQFVLTPVPGLAAPLGGGLYRFIDAGAVGQPRRFYLLREH